MILALAAMSLDLILGFGGMVGFGHAVYQESALIPSGSSVITELTTDYPISSDPPGLCRICPGDRDDESEDKRSLFHHDHPGIAQMVYFLGISLEEYGGDDGMPAYRSTFGDLIDLYDPLSFYFVFASCWRCSISATESFIPDSAWSCWGCKSNEAHAGPGISTYYKLTAFIIQE